MFHYHNQQLHCEAVPLARIAAEVGTPVYVYSRQTLLARAQAYRTAVPRALVCFAVKANGNPALLRLLQAIGLGADVTGGGELFLAQHAGVPADRIIYSGVGKTAVEIEAALDANIRALHVESTMEFNLVAAIATRRQQVVPIGVRVNPDIAADTHPYISTGTHAHKFGVDAATAVTLIRRAAAHNWLQPMGLAAHIGSQITALAPFRATAVFLVELADQLAADGICLHYLDVGGGLGVDYDGDGAPEISAWAEAVALPIESSGYDLVLEPGRSIAAPAGALLTRLLYTKQQEEKTFAIVDAGMTELIRPTLYRAHHPVLPLQQAAPHGERVTVDVVGPVCETGDWLARDVTLPPLFPGDGVALLQAGAYGFAMSSNYNGRLRPAEVLVDDTHFHLIRRRERVTQLLDNCLAYRKA